VRSIAATCLAVGCIAIAATSIRVAGEWDEPCIATNSSAARDSLACTVKAVVGAFASQHVVASGKFRGVAVGMTRREAATAIGAIGVSGAPGGQFDEECARAALAKIRDRMK